MSGDDDSGLFGELPRRLGPEQPAGGQPRLRRPERSQVELRAVSLEDLVAPEHRVRQVWAFVEGLDLGPLHARIKAVEGHPGHPPADPRVLLALWLFATVEGVGSARELARLCREHVAYQWLCGGVGVNHKTLNDFRIGHSAFLERLERALEGTGRVAGLAAAGREGTVAAQAVEFEESRSYLKRRWREYHPWRQSLE